MLRLEMPTVVAEEMLNTRLALLPLIDRRSAPGPRIVVAARPFSVSSPPDRGMIFGVLNDASNWIVSASELVFA
jgi:hypothetical protein